MFESNSQNSQVAPEWHDHHYDDRLLSDWTNSDKMMKPLPDIVRSLFEVTNSERVADLVSIPPLHLKLSVNALSDHLLDYKYEIRF